MISRRFSTKRKERRVVAQHCVIKSNRSNKIIASGSVRFGLIFTRKFISILHEIFLRFWTRWYFLGCLKFMTHPCFLIMQIRWDHIFLMFLSYAFDIVSPVYYLSIGSRLQIKHILLELNLCWKIVCWKIWGHKTNMHAWILYTINKNSSDLPHTFISYGVRILK
jgi:hypothetical protein